NVENARALCNQPPSTPIHTRRSDHASPLIPRKKSIMPVNTTNKIPPPGPSLRTFGKNPLYNAPNPSSLITSPSEGTAHPYFLTPPATTGEF
ncbi:hypothetical protein LTR33_016851, partial [Friedmanniomyces endolithicus]